MSDAAAGTTQCRRSALRRLPFLARLVFLQTANSEVCRTPKTLMRLVRKAVMLPQLPTKRPRLSKGMRTPIKTATPTAETAV